MRQNGNLTPAEHRSDESEGCIVTGAEMLWNHMLALKREKAISFVLCLLGFTSRLD